MEVSKWEPFSLNEPPVITNVGDISIENIDIKAHLTHYVLGSFSLAFFLALNTWTFGIFNFANL